VYNLAKEVKDYAYAHYGVSISKYDMVKQLPELKKEYPWIADVDAQALQAVVERLYSAYDKFFSGSGYPKWAKKDRYNSFLCKKGEVLNDNRIRLPKLGAIGFKNTWGLDPSLHVRTVTIKKESGSYFACITADYHVEKLKRVSKSIGIDLGVHALIATSEGALISPNIRYLDYANRLRLLQRKAARQKKFGSNWKKTKGHIARLHRKITNIRNDQLHKESSRIINENQVIVLEKLKVKNMSKSAAGTIEEPGINVKAKSGLNRSILNSSLGTFKNMLSYKAEWRGRQLILVDPKYTSQTCSNCGHTDADNRKRLKFSCSSCGYKDHADINAAKNILEKGILHEPKRKAVA
jgi:putative transposase